MKNELIQAISNKEHVTTLDLSLKENQAKLYNATSNATYKLDDLIDDKLAIVEFALFPYSTTDEETGEVHDGVQTIFFLDNGETVATSSLTVLQNFKTIVSIFGSPSVDNPIVVLPVKKQSNSSKYKYTALEAVC